MNIEEEFNKFNKLEKTIKKIELNHKIIKNIDTNLKQENNIAKVNFIKLNTASLILLGVMFFVIGLISLLNINININTISNVFFYIIIELECFSIFFLIKWFNNRSNQKNKKEEKSRQIELLNQEKEVLKEELLQLENLELLKDEMEKNHISESKSKEKRKKINILKKIIKEQKEKKEFRKNLLSSFEKEFWKEVKKIKIEVENEIKV